MKQILGILALSAVISATSFAATAAESGSLLQSDSFSALNAAEAGLMESNFQELGFTSYRARRYRCEVINGRNRRYLGYGYTRPLAMENAIYNCERYSRTGCYALTSSCVRVN